MPQAILLAATSISASIGGAAAGATGSLALGGVVADVAFAAVSALPGLAVSTGLSLAVGALGQPGVPPSEALNFAKKQSTPARVTGYGRAKLSGAYMRYTMSADTQAFQAVLAIHDGLIDGFEQFYLNDDRVNVAGDGWVTALDNPDGRYSTGDKVQILAHTGATPETAFSSIGGTTLNGWTAEHRGDGIASVALGCRTPLIKYYDTIYPNGLPELSVVARLSQQVLDVRTGARGWTQNPFLSLADYLTDADRGMGLSYARRIAPALGSWIAAANDCDSDQDGAPRYRCGGAFLHTDAPADVIGALLATCDGWLGTTAAGALKVYSGRYAAPTVTLGSDAIVGFTVQHGMEDESTVNALVINYSSPDHAYSSVEGESWRDEDSIAARGERPDTLSLPWVQDFPQARRLAKRKMSRFAAPTRGTVTTNLAGMEALGERYVQLQIPELAFDKPVEITKAEIDLAQAQLTFTWIEADPNIDQWIAEVETGTPPPTADEAGLEPLAPPTITGVAFDYAPVAAGAGGMRLLVGVDALDRDDVTFALRWREPDAQWIERGFNDVSALTDVVLPTEFVPTFRTLHVQVAFGVGDGRHSDWSDDFEVYTDPNAKPALPAPTGVSATGGDTAGSVSFDPVAGAGGYLVAFSDTPDFDPASYGGAVEVLASPAAIYGLAAGTFYAKVAAYDAWRQTLSGLNFSDEVSFVIVVGGGAAPPPGGDPSGPGGGTGGYCVAPEMLILMADGSEKPAGDLQVGDRVSSLHETTWAAGDYEVSAVRRVEDQERHVFEGLVATPGHRLAVAGAWMPISDLGSRPLDTGPVIAITVADAHTYYARAPEPGSLRMLSHNIKATGGDL